MSSERTYYLTNVRHGFGAGERSEHLYGELRDAETRFLQISARVDYIREVSIERGYVIVDGPNDLMKARSQEEKTQG